MTSSKPTSPPQGKKRAVEVDLSSDIAASADAVVVTTLLREERKLLPLLLLSPLFLVLPP